MPAVAGAGRERWWQGATVYQVYVRSWRDTDADGHGDLRGVIWGLDHLSWLGVDVLWLSPTMPSPNQDWGYDVSDYLGVHPDLGTADDLTELIGQAAARGIAVLLDLVPNHTSSAHAWFADACSGRDAAHRDYYVWADPGPGGGPPNNWRDPTGAPAWTMHPGTGQYYLHNFLSGQPDLNWWEPAVHEEFRQIMRFWFDRGVAGFRIDVAHGLYKDSLLRDNPPLPGHRPGGQSSQLDPVYSANRPETHALYRDWRRIADSYHPPRLLLGETWVGRLERMASYYGGDDELHLALNFPFLLAGFSADALARVVGETLAALPDRACPVWTGSNHDVGRFPTRWCGGDEAKARLALLVLATLPGTLVLYYGDEIALTDVRVPPERQRDQMTWHGLGRYGCRDDGRTPMPWDPSPGAGFTTAPAGPWLPLGDHRTANVATQREDRSSVLWLCHDLLALRRSEFAGRVPRYERLAAPGGIWRYRTGTLTVTANFSPDPVALPGPAGQIVVATGGTGRAGVPAGILGPWQGIVSRA